MEAALVVAAVPFVLCSLHQSSPFFAPGLEAISILVLCAEDVAELVAENDASSQGLGEVAGKELAASDTSVEVHGKECGEIGRAFYFLDRVGPALVFVKHI